MKKYVSLLGMLGLAALLTACGNNKQAKIDLPEEIETIETIHVFSTGRYIQELSESEIQKVADWAESMKLEPAPFKEGEDPLEAQGACWSVFQINDREYEFFYVESFYYSEEYPAEDYLYADDTWYRINEPSGLPFTKELNEEDFAVYFQGDFFRKSDLSEETFLWLQEYNGRIINGEDPKDAYDVPEELRK